MYFDIYVDGKRLGTFGHPRAENLNISVSGAPDQNYLFAGAVCREGNQQFHYDWLNEEIAAGSEVRIVPVESGDVPSPLRKFEMGRVARKDFGPGICEFCQRNETEVPRLIPGDAHRPGICSDCVVVFGKVLTQEI